MMQILGLLGTGRTVNDVVFLRGSMRSFVKFLGWLAQNDIFHAAVAACVPFLAYLQEFHPTSACMLPPIYNSFT